MGKNPKSHTLGMDPDHSDCCKLQARFSRLVHPPRFPFLECDRQPHLLVGKSDRAALPLGTRARPGLKAHQQSCPSRAHRPPSRPAHSHPCRPRQRSDPQHKSGDSWQGGDRAKIMEVPGVSAMFPCRCCHAVSSST